MAARHGPGGLGPRIDVTLGGKTYDLVPTFGALIRIEQALGAGLGALFLRFLRREHGVADTTRIIYEGIVAGLGNDAPDHDEVGAMVVREGIEAVAPTALDMLAAALRGLDRFAEDTGPGACVPSGKEPPSGTDPTRPRGCPGAASSAPRS